MRKLSLPLFLLVLCAITPAMRAENWPQWRGPTQDGVTPGKTFPLKWGEDKNVIWKTAVPGWGTSTPAIWEDRILLTCIDGEQNAVLCLNRAGKKQWQTPVGNSAGNRNRKASGSNPSPVTDGKHVYVYFRSGDLACLDLDGKIIWRTNLQKEFGPDRLNWDLGTSPVLTKELVVVAVMHQGPSYLVAFKKGDGEQVWKQDRDLNAPAEARDSYTTPLVVNEGGRETLLVLGADHVTAHAADTGKEVWRVSGLNPDRARNYRSISSPVLAGGILIAPYSRGRTLTGVRLGGKGDVTKTKVAWTEYLAAGDVPTPTAHDGRVYLCGDRGVVTCIDAKTGKELWTEELPRNRYNYSASPVLAGGRLYLTREDGTTFVLKLGDKPELIATNALRENTYATPVFVDGKAYVRTSEFLFCIGEK